VSLVLPGAATSVIGIAGSSIQDACFQNFTNLKEVSGDSIQTIGSGAFQDSSALQSVSLSAAASIGTGAFRMCTNV
jgi:hypothetical protein